MCESLMLTAELKVVPTTADYDPKLRVRSCRESDLDDLGRLYFKSYEPGDASETEADAIADTAASFEGEYGEFWYKASKIIEMDGKILGATLVVFKNSWDESITCPYIIELFVDQEHRRRNLARTLLISACNELKKEGKEQVALTVTRKNKAARSLYSSLNFKESL